MDNKLLQNIAKRIKELRKIKGYTQDDLAYYSGIPRSTIGNIEAVKNDIVLSKLHQIVKALDIELSDFFKFKNTTC